MDPQESEAAEFLVKHPQEPGNHPRGQGIAHRLCLALGLNDPGLPQQQANMGVVPA